MSVNSNLNASISAETKPGRVRLRVRDIERTKIFYEQTLGFEVLTADEKHVGLGTAPDRELVQLVVEPGAPQRPPRTTGLYHFAILVPNRRELAVVLDRLLSRSYPLQGAADHYVSEALYLADPEGNGIEVYADRSRDEWYSDDGKMRMGTISLDVDDLLSTLESNDERSARLPDGTRLGHVHLHVSDLEQAVAFYRDIIGFDLMMLYGPTAGFLSAGGYHHHIGVNTWVGEGAAQPPEDAAGLIDYSILVPDESELEQIATRAEASGYAAESGDAVLKIDDPSNNEIIIKAEPEV